MSEDIEKLADGPLAGAGGDAEQESYPETSAATAGASAVNAPKPVATTAQLADYLINGFWQYAGEGAHHWASNTITYNINGLNTAEKFLARSALNAWHEVANLTFVETTSAANITFTHNGTMTAYESDSVNGSGYTTSATVNISADWITNDGGAYDGKTGIDSYGYQTYIHEVGHALGLGHQGPYNGSATYAAGATYANDTWQYSVMSYFPEQNYDGGSYRYVITPQIADIYAAGAIYGAATTRTGDTVYGFNNTAGSIFNFSSYTSAPAFTIYDSGGNDTLDASGYAFAQIINLRSGSFSSIGGLSHNIGIATTAVIETGIGGSGSDALYASDTGNTLKGGGARDYLYGGNGADRLLGGSGSDIMSGGAGADVFVFAVGDSSASTGQHDIVTDFTAGLDQLDLTGIDGDTSTSGIMDAFRFLAVSAFDGGAAALNYFYDSVRGFTVLQGDVNGDLTADFAIDLTGNLTLTTASFAAGSLRTIPLNLSGTPGTDSLNGDWLGDTLYGLAGVDTLRGFGGADLLDGGIGADTMIGGAGDDTYYVDDAGDQVVENVNEGSDTVYTTTHLWLAANAEILVLQGSADLQGYGNALANTITGNAGNNILSGEAGADTLIGGLGNDAYFLQDAGDVVIEYASEGSDNVYIFGTFNYTLGANIENLLLQGTADLQGTGNALNNAIVGNVGNNVLDGGAGADGLYGGAGNDTYYVDNAGDNVVENASAGTDTVFASINYTLGANVENLTLTGSGAINGTGNALDNVITGNSGNNALVGGDGNDTAVFSGSWANYLISYDAGAQTYTIVDQRTGSPDGTDTATGIELFRFAGSTFAASASLNRAPTNATLSGGSVGENATNGTAVGIVTGLDPDAAETLIYSLTDNAGGRFAIHTTTGQLTVANGSLLDYEAATSHAITVRVTDHGGLTFDKVLTLNVTNVNETPSNAMLTGGTVAENAANGTLVGTVAGADPDAGATFSYALTNNAGGRFAVNATTGQLTVANGSLLDYETATSHAIAVRVTDQGGLTFDKALTVNLTNVNEMPSNATLTGSVAENAANGTVVGTVAGVDPDAGATLSYSLTADAGGRFAIDASGQLTVANGSLLNYESGASHVITVRVTDQGGLTFDKALTVNVTNVNEAPSNATLTGAVAENAANGTVVGTVAGVDPDAGATFSYMLTNNAGGRFAINASGQLTVADGSLLDYEVAISHAITVRVTDQGGLTFDKVLAVNVTNVNEAPSNATLAGGSVAENAANGTVVGTVAGVDPDAGATFSYVLTNNAGGRFAVNATSGQLTVANGLLLDYEAATSHAITVRVTDQGGLSFDQALTVAVTNVHGLSLSGQNGVNDTLTGAGEDDILSGLSGVDTLWGLGHNDILDGGAGADVMRGGLGDDSYYVDDSGDQVIENVGEGNDTVYTTTHLTLAANAENLVLQGTADLQGYGNALANTITGNSGNNILSGDAGADILIGGAGNDAYFLHDAGDQVIENANEGGDNVYIFGTFNYTLGANVENLLLQGTADLQGTGNALNNAIIGNSGNNVLNGAGGNDTLVGGAGNDTFVFHAGFGQDRINDFTAGAGTNDVIEFHDNIFADYAAVMAAASTVGANTVITVDGSTSITLQNVSLASLHQDDFRFI